MSNLETNDSAYYMVQYGLSVNTEVAMSDIRKLEISLIRVLGYAQRLTGDENLQKGIKTIQSAITALRTLQITIRQTEMATGPIGWLLALTSAVNSGLSIGEAFSGLKETSTYGSMMEIGE